MKFRTLCTLSLLVLAACGDDEETNTGTDTGADTTVSDTGTGDTTVEDTGYRHHRDRHGYRHHH